MTGSELILFAVVIAAGGALSGLMAGIFGIGGGAVLVPIFYQAMGFFGVSDVVRMHVAVGSSLAIIVPTSLRSFQGHYKRGAADMALLRSFVVPVVLGVILASLSAAYLSSEQLRVIFAAIMVVMGIRMLLNRETWRIGNDLPGNPLRFIIGTVIGFFSTLMGIGGGIMNNTFMTLYGRPMHQAVATSAGVGVLIAIPGVIGYLWAGWGDTLLPPFSSGFINWIAVILIVPVAMVTTPLGVRIAHAASKRQLETGFGMFCLFVAARFFVSLI